MNTHIKTTVVMKTVNQIRFVALMAAAATLFGGCEKESDNVVDNAPVAARIMSGIDAMATRAANTAWAVGDAIGISTTSQGNTKYTNVKYSAAVNGDFTPAGKTQRDTIFFQDKADVSFAAYYPYDGANGTAPGTDGILSKTITANEQTPEGQAKFDYLFATATGSSASPNVKFQFRHCMSRLVLNFLPGSGIASLSDLAYTIGALALEGTFDTGTGEAKMTATGTGSLSLSVPYSADGMSSTLIVFPQQANSADIKITMGGVDYAGTIDFPENSANNNVREFAPGHSYTYNITVNDTELTIKLADIKDWEGGDNPIDGGAFLN